MQRDETPRNWLQPSHFVTEPFWGPNEASKGLDLAGFWRLLVRRRWLIVLTIIGLTSAAALAISTLAPRYNAEALLLVRGHQPTLLDIQNAVRGSDTETSDSEIEILRSRRIAKIVVEKLGLTREPAINPALKPEGSLTKLRHQIALVLAPYLERAQAWLPATADRHPSEGPRSGIVLHHPSQADTATTRTADELLKHLVVAAKGRSRAVGVTYDANDPVLAAAVANAVVDQYVADQLDAKLLASAQANDWLSQRVAEIRQQVVTTDREVQQRKVDAGMTDGRTVSLLQEQMSGLSEQMMNAHAEGIQAETRLRQAEQARTAVAVSEILNSPLIQRLRADQSDAQRRLAAARGTFGDNHPAVIKLRAEVGDVSADIQREIGKVTASLRSDVEALRTREQILRQSLDNLKARWARIGAIDVDIAVQQREADANRALFDRILSRAKEANVESGLQKADAEVIAHADVPENPSFPNQPLFIAIAFLASSAVAGLIVVAVESLDHGFKDLEEAEGVLGVPALGFIPKLPRRGAPAPQLYAIERPLSAYAEAVRDVYTGLVLSDGDAASKRLLVTSSLPGEGKTSLSVSLARLMASTGRKVVLVDCDLRRRDVSRMLGIPAEPGLVDHLQGKISLNDAMTRDPVSGSFVIAAGSRSRNPQDLLGSDKMREMLDVLAETFDLIIMDSAPLLAVSDTRSLCRMADKVIMAVRWQHTRKAAVVPALKHISAAGGSLVGVLLTLADVKQLSTYSGNAYYFNAVQRYLAE